MCSKQNDQTTRTRRHTDRPGFSFIEIMVVVVIIGMLAGAVAMRFGGVVDKAKVERARNDIGTIVNAIELHYTEHNSYPGNDEGLSELPLKSVTDPWGSPYGYNSPGQGEPYEVFSLGADKRVGGEGQNADIYSWQLGEPAGDS